MKKQIVLIGLIVLFISHLAQAQSTFTLQSFDTGGQATNTHVFDGFGCKGKNESPQLRWKNAPKGTQSFAITMYDPDAPTGSGWWHWVIFDIPANTQSLPANAGNVALKLAPAGSIQSITDFGKVGYGGPCPPKGHGLHQYVITVYALKTKKLGLDKSASPAMVGYYLNANVLQKASLVMYYQR